MNAPMSSAQLTRLLRGRRALKSAAQDLGYEWNMARIAVRLLSLAQRARSQVMVNLTMETFLLHARNLRDFFATSGQPEDVLASDFLGRPLRVRMPLLRSAKIRRRLNKRIAHVSYSRSRLGRQWDVRTLATEIDEAMEAFVTRLSTIDAQLADKIRKSA